MSEHKCVPRIATVPMLEAGKLNTDQWCAAWDAAPACECEAERLLRDILALSGIVDDVYGRVARAREYLARSKP